MIIYIDGFEAYNKINFHFINNDGGTIKDFCWARNYKQFKGYLSEFKQLTGRRLSYIDAITGDRYTVDDINTYLG